MRNLGTPFLDVHVHCCKYPVRFFHFYFHYIYIYIYIYHIFLIFLHARDPCGTVGYSGKVECIPVKTRIDTILCSFIFRMCILFMQWGSPSARETTWIVVRQSHLYCPLQSGKGHPLAWIWTSVFIHTEREKYTDINHDPLSVSVSRSLSLCLSFFLCVCWSNDVDDNGGKLFLIHA